MSEATGAAAVRERLVALAGELRARGVRVGTGEVEMAARALAAVDASRRAQARLALRAVLCSRRDDVAVFDEAFAAVFGAVEAPPLSAPPPGARAAQPGREGAAPPPAPGAPRPGEHEERVVRPAAWSDVELLRDRDLARLTDAERAAVRGLLPRLARRGPMRRSRRLRPVRGRRQRLDLPRTVRASLRHGGEPLERRWRAPGTAPRRLVLVLDVSGSMAPYAQMLMRYAHASVNARRRVEVFALGTRLTHVTRELRIRDADRALERAMRAARDFGGGTRIGAAIGELNRGAGRRLGRGAVVVLLSDGWDRGDPERLSAEMARLRRTAHRLVWLNPLKARPGYEPLARGMAAALPHVDAFLEGHSLGSLETLADRLEEVVAR